MSLALLGADDAKKDAAAAAASGGFNYGSLIGPIMQAAGELAQGGISMYEQEQAKKDAEAKQAQSAAEAKRKLDAAIQADLNATLAMARAMASAQLKSPAAATDATVAEAMGRAQDRAAAGLSAADNEKRVDAAEKALDAAAMAASANPKDVYKQALAKAWTQTINKANYGSITGPVRQPQGGGGGSSWLTRPAVGPVPGWGVALGGAGLAAVLAKKFLF